MQSLRWTGKPGFDSTESFQERTTKALKAEGMETYPLFSLDDLAVRNSLFLYDAANTVQALDYFRLHAAEELAARNRYTVLEIGCGYGRWAPYLASMDCAGYVGVDPNPDRIAYARRHFESPLIHFECADGGNYRAGRKFDVIWMVTVIQHLVMPDKLRLCETIRTHLADGGFLLLDEGRIVWATAEEADAQYAAQDCASMIQMTYGELTEALSPIELSVQKDNTTFIGRLPATRPITQLETQP